MKINIQLEDVTPEELLKLSVEISKIHGVYFEIPKEDVDLRHLSKGGSESKFQIPYSYATNRAKYQQAFRICKKYGVPYPEAIKLYEAEISQKKGGPKVAIDKRQSNRPPVGVSNKWHIPFSSQNNPAEYEYARKICARFQKPYLEAVEMAKEKGMPVIPDERGKWKIPVSPYVDHQKYQTMYALCRKYNLPYPEALKKKEEEDILVDPAKQARPKEVRVAELVTFELPEVKPPDVSPIKEEMKKELSGAVESVPPKPPVKQAAPPKVLKGHTEPLPSLAHKNQKVKQKDKNFIGSIVSMNKGQDGMEYLVRFSSSTGLIWVKAEKLDLWVEEP